MRPPYTTLLTFTRTHTYTRAHTHIFAQNCRMPYEEQLERKQKIAEDFLRTVHKGLKEWKDELRWLKKCVCVWVGGWV